jgi:hypothetical protein
MLHHAALPPPRPSCLSPCHAGLPAAQRTIAERLPLFHALLGAVLKPSCARELEQLCGGLALLAGLVPPPFAGGWVGGWWGKGEKGLTSGTALLAVERQGQVATAGRAAVGLGTSDLPLPACRCRRLL